MERVLEEGIRCAGGIRFVWRSRLMMLWESGLVYCKLVLEERGEIEGRVIDVANLYYRMGL